MAVRKGSSSISAIPQDVLRALELGVMESATLSESLAINCANLMQNAFPDLSPKFVKMLSGLEGKGIVERMKICAAILLERFGEHSIERAASHTSDTVRGFACYMIAQSSISFSEKLRAISPLADDSHFGVREWSWMAMRADISQNLDEALEILSGWTSNPSENIRRFSSEAVRPKGVWCSQIKELREHPEKALPILEALKEDTSLYVKNSVGNWLNDASKSRPEWVSALCEKWCAEAPSSDTLYICKRASRTLAKKNKK